MFASRLTRHAQSGARIRVPLTLSGDAFILIAGNAATAVLGLVFWVVATTLYPVEAVGRATTLVTTGTVIASVSNLSMGPLLERFLPMAGYLRGRLIAGALTISTLCAFILGTTYALLMPGNALFSTPFDRLGFAVATSTLAAFALLDSILIGTHHTRWVALKNVGHAVGKLVAIVWLAAVGSSAALFGGWIITAALAIALIEIGLWCTRRRWSIRQQPGALPPITDLTNYGAVSLGWMLSQAIPGIAIPTIVVTALGVESAAYYNIAWTVVAASLMTAGLVTGPFVAAASRGSADTPTLARSFAKILFWLSLVRGIGVGVLGPIALYLYGAEYAEHGAMLLVCMGVAHTISGVAMFYGALARVARSIVYPMLVQFTASMLVVGLVVLWIRPLGITAVGLAFLTHDVLVLFAALPPLIGLLKRLRETGTL